jgi:hypothetical protein
VLAALGHVAPDLLKELEVQSVQLPARVVDRHQHVGERGATSARKVEFK